VALYLLGLFAVIEPERDDGPNIGRSNMPTRSRLSLGERGRGSVCPRQKEMAYVRREDLLANSPDRRRER
jgi:hypothetical protein